MRISEDTARALACSQLIASERHTSLIRDTFLFAAMCLTESPAKETIDENVQDTSAIFEKLGINGDYELDEDTFKALADKAFSNLRMDVRRLFANAAELSRRTGGRGAVGTEHLLFVILSKKVSNHIEIFDALEAAGADLEGLRNSLINSFNESMSSSGDDDDEDEEEGLFGGDERPGNNAPPRRNPEEGKSRKGGKGGHKTLEKFGKNLNDAKEVIANLPGKETYNALKNGSVKITVNGEEYEMTEEDFLIETTQPEGFSTQTSGNLTVSISTVLTEELIEDGLVREMISKIQNHRKETEGLTVSDRIVLKYSGNDKLAEVIEKKKEYLASEVLATEITNGTGDNSKEWNVNGEKITFSVVKA